MVKLLISEGAEINLNVRIPTHYWAFLFSNSQILEYLVKCGADLNNKISSLFFEYWKPLYQISIILPAVLCGYPDILEYLIKHKLRTDVYPLPNALNNYFIKPPENDYNQETVNSMKKMLDLLCQTGIGLYDCPDNPLLFKYVKYPEFFKYLISEKGVNLGGLKQGKNIIHKIAAKGDIELLKYVLKYQIPYYKVDDKGMTPYDIAVQKQKYEMASFLDSLSFEND